MKQKKCRVCKTNFSPFQTTQIVCGPKCAIKTAVDGRHKKERKAHRQAKQALKTRSDWIKEAQVAFNRFIRLRDAHLPCISCGTEKPDIQYAAGHYYTTGGHPELRFDELNVHKQCNKHCNLHLSGNIAAYRPNLIKKIGQEGMDYLEGQHQAKKYTIDEIKEIKQHYAKLARELEGNQ